MGVLGNPDHERFCQSAHARIWSGERHVAAYTASYRETIYKGGDCDDKAIAANVRKLRNRKDVKGRLAELADYAGKLAGIDAAWALVQLKSRVDDFNWDDYLTPRGEGAKRSFDLGNATREQLAKLAEIMIEEDTIEAGGPGSGQKKVRKRTMRLRPHEPAAIIGLMARIAGWEAPKKIAPTSPDGAESWSPVAKVEFAIIDPAGAGAARVPAAAAAQKV